MVTRIAVSPFGIHFMNEDGIILKERFFDSISEAVRVLSSLTQEKLHSFLMNELQAQEQYIVQENWLWQALVHESFNAVLDPLDDVLLKFTRKKPSHPGIQDYLQTHGNTYPRVLRDISIGLTKENVRHALRGRDKLVIQAINFSDDLENMINLSLVRIKEWYSLHFPELERVIENPSSYCRIVAFVGPRDNMDVDAFYPTMLPKEKVLQILENAENSMGTDLPHEDWIPLKSLAETTLNMIQEKKNVEKYISRVMTEIAPNMTKITGTNVGARLIALAGGLKELAMKPGSKIQVLGAEKALYRSLQTNAPPPKHGIIFQIPILGHSPWWIRGRLARFLASKIAIAARADAFNGNYIGDTLAQLVIEREQHLRKKYPQPPKGKKQQVFPDTNEKRKSGRKHGKPRSSKPGKRKKGSFTKKKDGKKKKKGGKNYKGNKDRK